MLYNLQTFIVSIKKFLYIKAFWNNELFIKDFEYLLCQYFSENLLEKCFYVIRFSYLYADNSLNNLVWSVSIVWELVETPSLT